MNYYTSYITSQKLHDAGVVLHRYPPHALITEDGKVHIYCDEEFEGAYPCYHAGELLRKLPTDINITLRSAIANQWKVLIGDTMTTAETLEDALALALLEIRKEKYD